MVIIITKFLIHAIDLIAQRAMSTFLELARAVISSLWIAIDSHYGQLVLSFKG